MSYNLQNIQFGTIYARISVAISCLIFFLIFVAVFPNMSKTFTISLIISILPIFVLAQDYEQNETESSVFDQLFPSAPNEGKVHIIQEPKLDVVIMQFIEENRKLNGIPCYWIRIYSGSANNAREQAYEMKARFLKKYDGIRNTVIYDDPNFKVYIGGYRSKSETLKLLNKISRDFPTAFIVYDIIGFPEK